jgi:hypothetical protein
MFNLVIVANVKLSAFGEPAKGSLNRPALPKGFRLGHPDVSLAFELPFFNGWL